MRDPLHRVSVRWKLALVFLGVCLLAFGVGGYLVSNSARKALEDEILARLDYQCRAYADVLDARLRLLGRRTEDFASDGYIRDRLDHLQRDLPAGDRERLRAELRSHLQRNKLPLVPAFLDLALVSARGEVELALRKPPSPALASAVAATPDQAGVWSSDLQEANEVDHLPTFALVTPVWDIGAERVIGQLVAWVHPGVCIANALRPTLAHAHRTEAQVELALLDRRRRELHVPGSFLGSGAPGPGSELVQAGFGFRLVEAGGEARAENTSPRRLFTRTLPIPVTGWEVRVQVEVERALSPVAGLQSRLLGYGALLALLACGLLFFPMRFLVRPLAELRGAALRIQGGDFAARVAADSEDEIGELARAFNHMAEAVEERTSRLEAAAVDLQGQRREIQDQRDRLQTVIHSMREGVMVLDADGGLVLWNSGAEPLVAWMRDDDTTASSHHDCHEAGTREEGCRACLFAPDSPARSCLVDVGQSVYEVHGALMPADHGGRRGRVLVARDISDRVAQDERQIHQERLAVLGEVAAVMAHELNNPLAAISMFNQMLAEDIGEDSPLQENVEVIRRNTETCKGTIRELLDYSTGSVPEVGAADVHEVIRDVERFLRPVSERSDVQWEWRLLSQDASVSGDEIQLRQVFVNLCMNALQAMEAAGGTLEISTHDAGGHVVLEVADSGPGVPEAVRGDVFRPFFTTKARGEGTGLGLPTARRIAEIHGGGLELAESRPGRTVFRVRLRRRTARPAAEEQVPHEEVRR